MKQVNAGTGARANHPFERCFHNLGEHSLDDALGALKGAAQSEQCSLNAYDWAQQALPGAELKPGYGYGTVEELHRIYRRDFETSRVKDALREN